MLNAIAMSFDMPFRAARRYADTLRHGDMFGASVFRALPPAAKARLMLLLILFAR